VEKIKNMHAPVRRSWAPHKREDHGMIPAWLVRHDFLQRCRDSSWPDRREHRGKYDQTQGEQNAIFVWLMRSIEFMIMPEHRVPPACRSPFLS
jgi:hypothetical protein